MIKALIYVFIILPFCASAGKFTVTNTDNAGSGSLRTALTSVNASTNISDTIIFNIPTSDSRYRNVGGNRYFEIMLNSNLPTMIRSNVMIDGYSQTLFTGNTNTATFRTSAFVGTGLDGVSGTSDDPVFPPINGAEIQITSNNANRKFATEANGIIIRGIAFRNVRLLLKKNTNGLIEHCTFGIAAGSFSDPGSDYITGGGSTSTEGCINIYGITNNLIIRNNLMAYANQRGIFVIGATQNDNLQIIENEIAYVNRASTFSGGGIEIVPIYETALPDTTATIYNLTNTKILRNIIHHAASTTGSFSEFGIEISLKELGYINGTPHLNNLLIENNTIYENTAGIRVDRMGTSSFSNIIRYNHIYNNSQRGIGINSNYSITVGTTTTNYVTSPLSFAINKNSIHSNGTLGIDLRPNNLATSSGVNTNDINDADAGANNGLNFPIIRRCTYTSFDTVLIRGYSQPNVTIELFAADNNTIWGAITSPTSPVPATFTAPYGTNGFGEGRYLIHSFVEGSAEDLAAGLGSYNDDGTGNTGLRTENLWEVKIPIDKFPSGFDISWRLTSTATDTACTSEFGPSPTLSILPSELFELIANKLTTGNNLQWRLASSAELVDLYLQTSIDGLSWKTATGGLKNQTSFLHANATSGKIYYRLVKVEGNNRLNYSNICLVERENQVVAKLSVYPNPNAGSFHLQLNHSLPKKYLISVLDPTGKTILNTEATLKNADFMNLNLPKGYYLLHLKQTENEQLFYSTSLMIK